MSGSITPGPSAGGGRLRICARFWLLIAVTSIWVNGNLGPPGQGPGGLLLAECPSCRDLGWKAEDGSPIQGYGTEDGSYVCENGHTFRLL
jgi:hypothetical protein